MGTVAQQVWDRVRGRRSFPPYELLDRDALGISRERLHKLESIYHAAQKQAWDGHEVLAELMEKHGGIAPLPAEQRQAIARLFTIILWGELAAWIVSAELADVIEDVEAKMAATSQAMDEARHFYVMRDYLLALDVELPPLDGFARSILVDLLHTDNVLHKLVGMQLLVENVALAIFRMIAAGVDEPVLRDLMHYFSKDEARHVGLGIQYLPTLLEGLGPVASVRLQLFQWKIMTLLSFGTHYLKESFVTLGLDWRDTLRYGMRTQGEVFKALTRAGRDGQAWEELSEAERRKAGRGLWVPRFLRNVNRWTIAQLYPSDDASLPGWHRAALAACRDVSLAAERVLRAAA